jgi:hypothetical protein
MEMPQRADALRGVALHMDLARHHVLGDALTGMAVHHDRRLLVHAGAVVADIAGDLDQNGDVDAHGHGMLAAWIEHVPVGFVGVRRQRVKGGVQFANRALGKVDGGHQLRSQT